MFNLKEKNMIENYEEVMAEWANPCVGTCTDMMEVIPDEDLRRWSVRQTITVLANADYYYTKDEVNRLLQDITQNALTRKEVQDMINISIASKANQADLEALSATVASNTAAILNTYTKQETNALLSSYLSKIEANEMFANYSKVEGNTLVLNSQNITI